MTIFAIPAVGPHGFHAVGRVIESTLRTANNLLERLHASFFFYIMTSSDTFLKMGMFLPSAVLVSVAMMFVGLGEWVRAGWVFEPGKVGEKEAREGEWLRRSRPLMKPLGIVLGTHVFGAGVFGALKAFGGYYSVSIPFIIIVYVLITMDPDRSSPRSYSSYLFSLYCSLSSALLPNHRQKRSPHSPPFSNRSISA